MILKDSVELWEMKNPSKSFLDDMVIHSEINRNGLLSYILEEYGTLITVNNDSETFHNHAETFFLVHEWTINRLVSTLLLNYNPIEDYNKTIDAKKDTKSNTTSSGSSNSSTSSTSTGKDVNFVSAFNQIPSNVEPFNDTESSRVASNGTSSSESESGTSTSSNNTSGTTDHANEHGLVNGKSYQQLIKEEREQAKFNIYKYIGRIFADELLIGLW